MIGEFFRWSLLAIGATYLITEAVIFVGVRVALARRSSFLETLVYCPACTGFWVGCALFLFWPFTAVDTGVLLVASILQSGVASMALGAAWGAWKGGNPAYEAETPLREIDDDTTPSQQER